MTDNNMTKKTQTKLKPFNDFFVNCYTNALLTFITQYDTSYLLAANLNSYSHFADGPDKKLFPYLFANYNNQFYENFNTVIDIEQHVFQEVNKRFGVDELIAHIENNKKIIIYVDLYYWTNIVGRNYNMPNQIHMKHAITIVDYDRNTECFEYFDMDNEFQFNSYTIQSIQMAEVISLSRQYLVENNLKISEYDYSIILPKKGKKNFVFNMDIVKKNAERIIEELNFYKKVTIDFEQVKEELKKNTSLIVIKATIYSNVHKGNKRLFQYLNTQNILSDQQLKELNEMEDAIIYKNNLILTGILFCEVKNSWEKSLGYTKSRYALFDNEIEVWSKFLQYLNN